MLLYHSLSITFNRKTLSNILYTPEVDHYISREYLYKDSSYTDCHNVRELHYGKKHYFIPKRNPNSNKFIDFVVNPSLDIDFQNSDIKAVFEIEQEDNNIPIHRFWKTNLQTELQKQHSSSMLSDIWRPSYYGLANIERCVPYLEQTTQTKIFKNATRQCFSWETHTWQDNNTKIKFYVKIIARLKPRNENQDILFVAKYPVKLNVKELPDNLPLNLSYAISSSPENLPEDIVIPDGTTYSQNTTVRALNTISFGNVILTNGAKLNLEAGQIIARQNAVINPNISVKAISLYGNNPPQSPANPNQILTFCNSSVYKVPSRYQGREEEEKEFSIKKEEETINLSASPNPTKSDVTISYFLERDAKVLVYVSNIMGERVYTLTDREQSKGSQEVSFNTQNLPAGIYLYTLETEQHKITKRLVVVK